MASMIHIGDPGMTLPIPIFIRIKFSLKLVALEALLEKYPTLQRISGANPNEVAAHRCYR